MRDALANGGNANSLDRDGTSALQFAVKYGHAEVVQVLLDSPDLALNSRFQFPYNGTPLQLAARYGNEKIVQLLINDQRVDVNITDKENNTPLHDAAKRGHNRIVVLLLNHPHIKANFKNKEGHTPLMSALVRKMVDCVRDMLSHPKVDLDTNVWGWGLNKVATMIFNRLAFSFFYFGYSGDILLLTLKFMFS